VACGRLEAVDGVDGRMMAWLAEESSRDRGMERRRG